MAQADVFGGKVDTILACTCTCVQVQVLPSILQTVLEQCL
jgi:hypothetical protein